MRIKKPEQVHEKEEDKDEDEEQGLSDVKLFQGCTLIRILAKPGSNRKPKRRKGPTRGPTGVQRLNSNPGEARFESKKNW